MENIYSTQDEKIKQYLDGRKGNIQYIKKSTFDKAVGSGNLIRSISGVTTLKKIKDINAGNNYIQISDSESYVLGDAPLTRVVGYIPTSNGTFIEYKQFNVLYPIALIALLVFGTTSAIAISNVLKSKNIDNPPANVLETTTATEDPLDYDQNQTTEEPEKPSEPVKEIIDLPSITMPGYSELAIPENTTQVKTISLYNPSKNEGYYDLSFIISLDTNNDGEFETTLYKSGKVSPGHRINEITLNQPLKAGKYSALITINTHYIPDPSVNLNNGEIVVPLIVG